MSNSTTALFEVVYSFIGDGNGKRSLGKTVKDINILSWIEMKGEFGEKKGKKQQQQKKQKTKKQKNMDINVQENS